jgi:acyl-CoA thioester hydrolase
MEGARRLGQRRQVAGLEAFRDYRSVRYVECDAQKVVFNSRDGEYVDVAIDELVRAIGFMPDALRAALQAGAVGKVTDHAAFL